MRQRALYLALLLLGGCAVGPDYVKPEIKQPAWHAPLPHGGEIANLTNWWEQFNDPVLTKLIADAEHNSPSLDQAIAKVKEARAGVDSNAASYYPTVGATGSAARSKSLFGRQIVHQTVAKAGFDAGWELDFFGKNRRSVEAAEARLRASGVSWHDARISLAAEVADTYAAQRGCEVSLDAAERIMQSRTDTLRMTEAKAEAGLASKTELARSRSGAADSASELAAQRSECERGINRLVALTGIERGDLLARLSAGKGQLPVPNVVAVDAVAAKALSQRPDVALAESNLAAASAEIGAAKADLYPSLTLLGAIAANRVSFAGQAMNASTWSFGPSLTIPILDGGRRRAVSDSAQARYDYAQAAYRKTVREAVREIEDALVRLDTANTRLTEGQKRDESQEAMYQATESRYQAGMASRMEREDALRSRLQTQDMLAALKRETVSAWIALYKALGGGWDGNPVPGTTDGQNNGGQRTAAR
ncbi:MAG: efflux transporter outer membrane subunit [Pseudomonadota bacterium]